MLITDQPANNNEEFLEPVRLPQEILAIIFQDVLDDTAAQTDCTGIQTLLNCRMVCSAWKNAVDNDFMGKLFCTITNIHEFLISTICTKVKNLRFVRGLSADQITLEVFFSEIIPDVERIVFNFPDQLKYNQLGKITNSISPTTEAENESMLFSKLMKSAKNLKEIKIESSNSQFLRELSTRKLNWLDPKSRHLF